MQRHKQPSDKQQSRGVCRQFKEHPDGQRRWDQAYQHLLSWATENQTSEAKATEIAPPQSQQNQQGYQEVPHASSSLCPRLDARTDTKPEH